MATKQGFIKPQRCLLWTGSADSLNNLADLIFKKNYIFSENEFKQLFAELHNDAKIRCNANKLLHMAYLLYRLKEDNFFLVLCNKGYFSYAEEHFTDFEGNNLRKNKLKNLSSKVNTNKDKYRFICKEIDDIINAISNDQKGLL
jgi:hypothetical protein